MYLLNRSRVRMIKLAWVSLGPRAPIRIALFWVFNAVALPNLMLCALKKYRGYLRGDQVSPRHHPSNLNGVATCVDGCFATQVTVFTWLGLCLIARIGEVSLALPLIFEEGSSDWVHCLCFFCFLVPFDILTDDGFNTIFIFFLFIFDGVVLKFLLN